MKLALLAYTSYLAFFGVDPYSIPGTCHTIKYNKNILEKAEWITGHHDQKADDYQELSQKKYEILQCDEKFNGDLKYLRRYDSHSNSLRGHKRYFSDYKASSTYLKVMHCPELDAFLNKHKEAQAEQMDLKITHQELFDNVHNQYNRLNCSHAIHHHNQKHIDSNK